MSWNTGAGQWASTDFPGKFAKKLMRVLHVIPSLDLRDGGPSVALPQMARSLDALGLKIDVATTMSETDAAKQGIRLGEPQNHEGYTVRYFKRQTGFYKLSLPLRSWVRSHAREYDLLHIHALFSHAPLAAARAARGAGVPYIMRPLGLLNSWGMQNRRRWVKAASFRLLDRPALNHASAIHYTSAAERDEAARLHLKSRAVVVPLGIDTAPFGALPSAEIFFAEFPPTRGRDIVLFLSRIDPKKGLDDLLPAFAKVRAQHGNALLVIAGSGNDTYVNSLKNLARKLGMEEHVLWTGALEGQLKLAAYAAAGIFVLPSYSENFGIALLEAMAARLACISTEGVALAREAGDAVLRVEPGVNTLHGLIASLLENKSWRTEIGARAAALVNSKYALDAVGHQLAAMYESALETSAMNTKRP